MTKLAINSLVPCQNAKRCRASVASQLISFFQRGVRWHSDLLLLQACLVVGIRGFALTGNEMPVRSHIIVIPAILARTDVQDSLKSFAWYHRLADRVDQPELLPK